AEPRRRGLPRLRSRAGREFSVIVRWGLEELPGLLRELPIERPLLVTSERWDELELPAERRFLGVRSHAAVEAVRAAIAASSGADGLLAVGGGSAIDTAKAVSADRRLPVVAVPTTYAGAEWTPYFGMRDAGAGLKRGGTGAWVVVAVYEPRLTL